MMPLYCPSLRKRPQAIQLGTAFAQSFASNSVGRGKGEIDLFQAMQESLGAIAQPPHVVVEEYHGANHQVAFTGSGTYSRTKARCELSDLLVVVYDRQTKDARLTYIQAKSERGVAANANGVAGQPLVANLEQWDLLARRPQIAAAPGAWGRPSSFNPPQDLLSGAQLCSIGSFAFFLHGPNGVDIYYSAASQLCRPPRYVTRYGKLVAVRDVCRCGPAPECLSVYGNSEFGAFLFGLMIGTPILLSGRPATASVCTWLAAQLRGFATQAVAADARAEVTSELADLLDSDRAPAAPTPSVGARTFLLFGLGSGEGRRA
jgi:hypothetical protein